MNKKMNNKGFSLVELIVVIAIMAVLVGVLAPQFIKYVEKSRQSTDLTNLDSIKQVVVAYYADKEGTDLPTKVVIKQKSDTDKTFALDITGGTASSDTVLEQGGVKDTKIKGKWDAGPEATWDLTDNKWEYNGTSSYYKTDATTKQIVPE